MIWMLLMALGLLYLMQQKLYQRYWNKNLKVNAGFTELSVHEGDASFLREEITNDKWLPLPALEVNLKMARTLKFTGEAKENANVTDYSYKRDVFTLFMHQKVIRKLSFVCEKRGHYTMNEVEVIGHDFFFRKQYREICPQRIALYVYPRLVDTRRITPVCLAISGTVLAQNRLYPDPFEFAGIREYRPEDPMRHINWKASARNTQMMVNQFDFTTKIKVRMILDTEDSALVSKETLLEEGIRIAASLALQLVKQKMELTVTGNGIEETVLKGGAGYVQEIYRKLACIDLAKQMPTLAQFLRQERKNIHNEEVCVIISANQDEKTKEAITSLSYDGCMIIWICPSYEGEAPKAVRHKNIQVIAWEV